jgi:hypothetical protein
LFVLIVIWSKGDACLAPYSEDGEEKLFKARIKGFQTKAFTQTAIVGYVGYGSSGDEEVELKACIGCCIM